MIKGPYEKRTKLRVSLGIPTVCARGDMAACCFWGGYAQTFCLLPSSLSWQSLVSVWEEEVYKE